MKNLMMTIESASRPCWLIVDDNQDILSLMRDVVAQCIDADVLCFHSPHAALVTFAAAPEAVDFVITDLEMPGMSGLELGSRLRQLSPAIKVLLVTGSGILTEPEAVKRGFCGLLVKPFHFGALRQALENTGVLAVTAENKSKLFAALTMA